MAALTSERERRTGYTTKVLELFKANPKVWIKAEHFMDIAGVMAWRTRISDARKIVEKEGGVIENRLTHIVKGDPEKEAAFIVSEYRYLPYVPQGRDASEPAPTLWPAFDAPIQETWSLKP